MGQTHLAITRGAVWIPSPSDFWSDSKSRRINKSQRCFQVSTAPHHLPAARHARSPPKLQLPRHSTSAKTRILPPPSSLAPSSRRVLRHARLVRKTARASMHPFSVLTLGIFVAGYITARWDLVTRLCELAIFAWEYGVVVSRPLEPCSTPSSRTGNSLLTVGIPADSRRESLPRAHPCVSPHIHPCGTSCDPGS